MTSTIPSAALVPAAYELDLRQFASSCQQHQLCLFQARRADIECFRARPRSPRPRQGHRHAAALHRRWVLQVRR